MRLGPSPSTLFVAQEMKEISEEESPEFAAEALPDNIFEWVFAIRGPQDSGASVRCAYFYSFARKSLISPRSPEFEGGIYIGRISLPADYPLKPPSFQFLTPNGRWETNKKICLSISSHHPDTWQPSWSMRRATLRGDRHDRRSARNLPSCPQPAGLR